MHSKEVIYLKVYKTYLSPGINELEKHLKRYYGKWLSSERTLLGVLPVRWAKLHCSCG